MPQIEHMTRMVAIAVEHTAHLSAYHRIRTKQHGRVDIALQSDFIANTLARHIGFRPQDSSEPFRTQVEAADPQPDLTDPAVIYQGGPFVRTVPFE